MRLHESMLFEPMTARANFCARKFTSFEAFEQLNIPNERVASCARARAQDATRSFGMFSCSKASNEVNFLAQKFARSVMGSNNIDSCNRT